MSKSKYLRTTVTTQNCIYEEINKFLRNACYHSVQSLSSRLLSKNIILPVVLYECEIWPLALRKDYQLRVFENRVLRRIFGPKRKWQEVGEDCIMRSFMTCTLQQILLGRSSHGGLDERGM
jgi:hypothetical protein